MTSIVDYIKTQLNEEQSLAALHTDTSSLIIAGAGSGKTRTLMYKIGYLVFGRNIPIQRILAVTFTNKAAHEMKERLVSLAGDMSGLDAPVQKDTGSLFDGGNDSIDSFIQQVTTTSTIHVPSVQMADCKWIGTFHSIFLKILKEDIEVLQSGYTKHFSIFDTNESKALIKDILKKMNLQEVVKDAEVKGVISRLKNE